MFGDKVRIYNHIFRFSKEIENGFYFDNPDKLLFLMKEFKSHLHPE